MQHQIVSRDEWQKARIALLAKEKELTRLKDRLSAERRELPWVEIEKTYVFEGPAGKLTLADLFEDRSQLFVKHFMMGPGQTHHCVGCFFEVDHMEGILVHLQNHDVTYVAVARAPIDEIETIRRRMGWRFPFVSSFGSDFNYDFNVSFTREQLAAKQATYNYSPFDFDVEDLSGNSVFYKDDTGRIFHTFSSFGRGGESFLGTYGILDMTPKGRDETGPHHSLTDWVRPHDMYGKGGMVEPIGRYHETGCDCAVHR